MTIFAGILARGKSAGVLPEHAIEELGAKLSRHGPDAPRIVRTPRFALATIDLNVLDGPSLEVDPTGAMTVLAGDPILRNTGGGRTRGGDLHRLHEDCRAHRTSCLRDARGAFCAAHIDPAAGRVWLITDKLGLRPIYYSVQPQYVVFATAFRILSQSTLVDRRGDLQALAETACLGYPLGPRSQLAQVRSVEPGQVVEILPETMSTDAYWRWDDVEPSEATDEEFCRRLFAVFRDAISIRLGARKHAAALLSGGLDSRCVAAGLRSLDAHVDTIGFGPEGTADQIFGRQAAAAMRTRHFELTHGVPDFWPRLASAFSAWRQQAQAEACGRSGGHLWSGEGGDRVLAPVNLSARVVSAMRNGAVEAAIGTYMRDERAGLPPRLFQPRLRDHMLALPRSGIRSELERRTSHDPARRFHVYVLTNESRRNIARHFEDLDLNRFELVMPFYDSDVVQIALSHRFDPFIAHRLYYRWLAEFPPEVASVPWQAYPSSAPCPLPVPDGIRMQWDRWYSHRELQTRWQYQESLADNVLNDRKFPDWLLNRTLLRCARVLHRMGLRSYGYLFEVASPFLQYPPALPRAFGG
ncbi:MAG: asparagine synthase-related protein [Gammaproteobacteria bacterium]